MTEEPRQVAEEEAKRDSHDGLAALAVTLLAVFLIALVVVKVT